MLITESSSKILVCCLFVSLCGCSEIQTSKEYQFKYRSNRPDKFPPKELDIIIGNKYEKRHTFSIRYYIRVRKYD
ncbi:MAG: hypothetical protein IJ730_00580 [Alphaproteobacteria bacterium]|nr:hypothetical protein [Alphaproteobacteria bacterium]